MPTTERNTTTRTVRIADKFNNVNIDIDGNDYDIVYSYFLDVSNNESIASNFAAFFFRISKEANLEVKELLELIKGQTSTLEMNKIIAYYLNAFRSRTALYGTGITPKPNPSIQRNVVI